jgi:uncharacterized protein (UPF0179 family)
MQRLSYDMSRCAITEQNKDCPVGRECLRRLDPGREKYQAHTAFDGGLDCDGFIQAKEEK